MRKKSDGDLNLIAVGSRIQQRRKDLHISQEILAEKAGISTSSLSLIENGHINLSVMTLSRIAHELNCTMDDLFYGISNKDAYMEEVKKALADCSDQEKAFLVGLLMDARQRLKELKK
ncbi:MAG: helix-turn-helix transcriptional regulator [Lachnospiraceae bacterium]|nr:helix-turn-helix transcriptional regulator [Lachnospiraceae bacterium]